MMPVVVEPAFFSQPLFAKLLQELLPLFEATRVAVAAPVVAVEMAVAVKPPLDESDAEGRGELD
jgi:hypothetical protein